MPVLALRPLAHHGLHVRLALRSFPRRNLFQRSSIRYQLSLPSFLRTLATMAPIERVTDKLEAPALDDRSYRVIQLPNKLEALLVHDPETDKASASVNVNVGSFSDADDMPGMAHAVEHLLFMGTKKVCAVRASSDLSLTLSVSRRECLQPVSHRSLWLLQRLHGFDGNELLFRGCGFVGTRVRHLGRWQHHITTVRSAGPFRAVLH